MKATNIILALGIGSGLVGCSDEVFKGKLGDKEVSYVERAILPENKMRITRGDTLYTLKDTFEQTRIQWKDKKKPDFERDLLERVEIEYPGFWDRYEYSDIFKETIEGKHASVVFNRMNPWYNQLRAEIRDSLRARYEIEHESLERALERLK